MRHAPLFAAVAGLSALVAGCGGSAQGELPEDQRSPEYGKQSTAKMVDMYGTPKVNKDDAKSAGDRATDKMRSMYSGKK